MIQWIKVDKIENKIIFYVIENNNNTTILYSRALKLGKRWKHVKNHIFLFSKYIHLL